MIGAIEGTAGITITTVMGKPSVLTALTALDILGVKAEDCLMSGIGWRRISRWAIRRE